MEISELSESDHFSVPPVMPQMNKFVCCLVISRLEEGEKLSHTFQGLGGEPKLANEAQLREKVRTLAGEGHENRPGQGTHIKPPLRGHIYTYDINIYS